MRLEHIIVACALFGFIILGGSLFIGDLNITYGLNMSTEDFGSVYDTINSTYNMSLSQKNTTLGADITSGDTFDSALRGSFSAIRQSQNMFAIVFDVLQSISSVLGVPPFVIYFFITAFLAVVTFSIIYLFVRFQPR